MPSYIVKPVRGRDEYVIWSTVVDAPTAVGDRDEILRAAAEMYGYAAGDPARVDRADSQGASGFGHGWFGWDYDVFWLGNMHWDPGPIDYQVQRANLAAYARADLTNDTAACLALVEPYTEEDG